MSTKSASALNPSAKAMTNGSGAAAVLAAGLGSITLAVVAIVADQSKAVKSLMNFYHPTGPLSGVTTTAIVVWVFFWILLELCWRNRNVAMGRIHAISLSLLVLSLLLTFPPIADLL
ncbi:MAG: hypothetical protein ACLPH3_06800 [Terracidiphilus sp.]